MLPYTFKVKTTKYMTGIVYGGDMGAPDCSLFAALTLAASLAWGLRKRTRGGVLLLKFSSLEASPDAGPHEARPKTAPRCSQDRGHC